MKMTTEGFATLKKNRELPKQLSVAYRKTAYQLGRVLRDWLLQDMKKPKTGREYKSYFGVKGRLKRPKLVRASAPSETPAVRTGNFRKSVNFIVRGNKTLEWGSGKDGFATSYNKALEFGSKNMKARAPLQRSMQANEGRLKALAISNIEKVVYGR
jgi:hypothetical protein